MSQDPKTPTDKPTANEYTQPLIIASLAAIVGFGYIVYRSGDLTRGLAVGGVVFIILFWVVLRGNKLKKRREKEDANPTNK